MTQWTGRPAYQQVADDLRLKIRSGRFAPGAQLPPLPELIDSYRVSITVVRQALGLLRSEGLIATHQGKGSFVLDPLPEASPEPGSVEHQTIMQRLDELAGAVQRLESRLGELESRDR